MARGSSRSWFRNAAQRVLLAVFALMLAIVPRSAGAIVVHAHEGHGLHAHLVSGLEDARSRLDSASFQARNHAHQLCDGHHVDHEPDGEELRIGLPSEPVRSASAVAKVPPPLVEPGAAFEDVVASLGLAAHRAPNVRPRPPRPRGREPRSGSRRLLRTSSALLL